MNYILQIVTLILSLIITGFFIYSYFKNKQEFNKNVIKNNYSVNFVTQCNSDNSSENKYLLGCKDNSSIELNVQNKSCVKCSQWKIIKHESDSDDTSEIKNGDIVKLLNINCNKYITFKCDSPNITLNEKLNQTCSENDECILWKLEKVSTKNDDVLSNTILKLRTFHNKCTDKFLTIDYNNNKIYLDTEGKLFGDNCNLLKIIL